MYIGTTGLALNRGTGAVALEGITSIDGSAAKLTTPRALKIGSTAKNFDGSAAVSWSLEDINTHLNNCWTFHRRAAKEKFNKMGN